VEVALGHPLAAPVTEFLTDLANANRSAHTVRCYRGDLAGFAATHPGGVGTIDAAALRRFFATLSTQAPATRARKQAALASFLTWCCRQDLLPADPMAELERISVPERSPRGVPPVVVARVLDTIPKRNLRDRVLFGVIAATGLRAAEALGIYVTDLELARDDEHLTVRGKGGRTRTVLLDDPGLVVLLHRYLRDTGYTRGPLFRANKNHVGGPLRYSSAEELWSKYCGLAGEKVSLHQLRHTHATELLSGGVPIDTVRKRLGHRHLAATLLYANRDDQTADDEIRAWQRRRPTPKPSSAPSARPTPAVRSRHACPHCGNEPAIRQQALQQRADLAEVWLEPDGHGELTETHHCAACAPPGPVTDLACAVCGDGPLLVGADEPAAASGTIIERGRRWLTGHGWQIEPELTCPHHTLAQEPHRAP